MGLLALSQTNPHLQNSGEARGLWQQVGEHPLVHALWTLQEESAPKGRVARPKGLLSEGTGAKQFWVQLCLCLHHHVWMPRCGEGIAGMVRNTKPISLKFSKAVGPE